MARDYSKGKIYCIKVNTEEEYLPYVGSTTKQYLSQRIVKHRNSYKQWKKNEKSFVSSFTLFERFGIENCYIELIELFPCKCNDELLKQEREWFDKIKNCNQNKPFVTKEEMVEYYKIYNETHKEEISEKNKIHYDEHKEEILEKAKIYQQTHKEEIAKKGKIYRNEHKEEISQQKKEYCKANRDIILEKKKEQYKKKVETVENFNAIHYQKYKDSQKEPREIYRETHKTEKAEYDKKRREEKADEIKQKKREYYHRKKEEKRLSAIETHTAIA